MIDQSVELGGSYESRAKAFGSEKEAAKADARLVKVWLDAIELASKEEEVWRKRADETVQAFRDQRERTDKKFNILYSNIETIVPAIYSSQPNPDVRRRFNDKDPAARVVSQILERAISFSIDQQDFDATLRAAVYDNELVGRAVTRVRYVPYFSPSSPDPSQQDEGEPRESPAQESAEHTDRPGSIEAGEVVSYEEVICEHVPWVSFRHGPAKSWAEVPWIAFELFLTREQVTALNSTAGPKIELDSSVDGIDELRAEGPPPDVFLRARVWEIWDKETKKVMFIAPCYKEGPLLVQDDPLQLQGFFPIPRPMYAIESSDSLVPIEPYRFYKDQAEELDRVTRRITKLIQVLKYRGFYPGSSEAAGAMTQLADADDGEFVPVSDFQSFVAASGGDLSKAFWTTPVDVLAKVLTELYQQREQIQEVIRQLTGIADIMRGETKPNETLGAQQIKTQWGSLRIQRRQQTVQRYARDLFRIMAEMIAENFSFQNIQMMTGVKLLGQQQKQAIAQQMQAFQQQAQAGGQPMQPSVPPDVLELMNQPSIEEVEQILKSDLMRTYRVDIESDSTIRGDLQRYQENAANFLTGSAQYFAAVGPLVQEGAMPKEAAVKIYLGYARNFKLGKQVEDTLESLAEQAEKASQQPPPPDPEEKKLALQQQADQHKMQMEEAKANLQAMIEQKKIELEQTRMQMEAAKVEADIQLQREKAQAEIQLKREIAMLEAQANAERAQQEMALTERTKSAEVASNHEIKMKQLESSHALGQAKIASDGMLNAKKIKGISGEEEGAETPDAFDKMAASITELANAVIQSNKELQEVLTRPRTVTTPDGRKYTSN